MGIPDSHFRRRPLPLHYIKRIYKGYTTVHFESLFTLDRNNKGTRGHLAKLSKPRCQKMSENISFHIV